MLNINREAPFVFWPKPNARNPCADLISNCNYSEFVLHECDTQAVKCCTSYLLRILEFAMNFVLV
ncbi:Uncharacterised protein [Burkholderia pseudomallei]|nr:Uncharacterised protein [Burkholderia pseudomallei]CAK0073888.1 Uncharacterised protein [Burkholderia pseudomallei]